ncbi:MAG: DUF4111 domain-containing protein [Anaerolineae bacterium]|nr:DUF4111 domain-containing protein [Anaerolineae bacterium]
MQYPTPYPDANAVLDLLLSGSREIFGARLIGMYLYGSLATGDFDPATSDVDFVVVTDAPLDAEVFAQVGALHRRIAASGLKLARKLEGAYTSPQTLRRFDPTDSPSFYYNEDHEDKLSVSQLGGDWIIQRHVLREHGVVISGPPLKPMIDPVSPDAIREAVRELLGGWWASMLTDATFLQPDAYQVFAVKTMCRALYTLEHGAITSKPDSVRWALAHIDAAWHLLITAALDWQPGSTFDRLPQTLAFITYTLDRAEMLLDKSSNQRFSYKS